MNFLLVFFRFILLLVQQVLSLVQQLLRHLSLAKGLVESILHFSNLVCQSSLLFKLDPCVFHLDLLILLTQLLNLLIFLADNDV